MGGFLGHLWWAVVTKMSALMRYVVDFYSGVPVEFTGSTSYFVVYCSCDISSVKQNMGITFCMYT